MRLEGGGGRYQEMRCSTMDHELSVYESDWAIEIVEDIWKGTRSLLVIVVLFVA